MRLIIVVSIIIFFIVGTSIYMCKPNKIDNCRFVKFIKIGYTAHKTNILIGISIVSLLAAVVIAVINIIRSHYGHHVLNNTAYNTAFLLLALWCVLLPSICARDVIQACAARSFTLIVALSIAVAEISYFVYAAHGSENFASGVTLFLINSSTIGKVLSAIGVIALLTYSIWASYDIMTGCMNLFIIKRQGCNPVKSDSDSVQLQIFASIIAAISYIMIWVIIFQIFYI
jgi:hypothetical protein